MSFGVVHLSITSESLAGPVLRRVAGILGARVDLPLDLLDETAGVIDKLASQVCDYAVDGQLDVEIRPSEQLLELRFIKLGESGGEELLAAIEQLATDSRFEGVLTGSGSGETAVVWTVRGSE